MRDHTNHGRGRCGVASCDRFAWAKGFCGTHYSRFQKYGNPNHVAVKQSPAGAPWAFMEAAIRSNTDDCILWPYSRNNMGYAQINETGSRGKRLVTRRVCVAIHGEPPTIAHVAAHSCGNGHLGCINPRHLRWATSAENSQEMVLHGRSARGRSMARVPLSVDQVLEIYRRAHGNENQGALASEFGIAQTAVSKIKLGKSWGWLTKSRPELDRAAMAEAG